MVGAWRCLKRGSLTCYLSQNSIKRSSTQSQLRPNALNRRVDQMSVLAALCLSECSPLACFLGKSILEALYLGEV